MSTQILLVDSKKDRATWLESLFQDKDIPVERVGSLHEAVRTVDLRSCPFIILAHCDYLNDSFTSMARLRQNPMVKILFYTTDPREKLGSAPLIPDEIDVLIKSINRVTAEQSSILR